MRSTIAIALVCFGVQQPQTPVFRGGADVVVANVQVTSRDGSAIEGLTAGDFSLKVDGKPRAIASVEFQRIDDGRPAAAADAANASLSMGPTVRAQSFVMLAVDPALMRPESSRLLFDQAAEFVVKLPAAHAVGLTILPARQPQFPFSTVRQPIAAALRQQQGSMSADADANESDTLAAMSGFEAAISALMAADGQRTLVYFSDILPPDRNGTFKDLLTRMFERAADANIVVHTVTTAAPTFAGAGRRATVPPVGHGLLEIPSGLTGGMFLERGSNGAVVLPRIARTLAAQYVLTFNVENPDKDGRPHKIDVKVNRKDADVRFRKEFAR